jgi:hypothetical protein
MPLRDRWLASLNYDSAESDDRSECTGIGSRAGGGFSIESRQQGHRN